jgi:hypothetical protein
LAGVRVWSGACVEKEREEERARERIGMRGRRRGREGEGRLLARGGDEQEVASASTQVLPRTCLR